MLSLFLGMQPNSDVILIFEMNWSWAWAKLLQVRLCWVRLNGLTAMDAGSVDLHREQVGFS